MEYKVGDKISGRLEVRDLKRGGMGTVYIIYDYKFNRTCALKSFQDKYFEREEVIRGFHREAETWIRLGKHGNIVEAFFVYQIDNKPHIFLE